MAWFMAPDRDRIYTYICIDIYLWTLVGGSKTKLENYMQELDKIEHIFFWESKGVELKSHSIQASILWFRARDQISQKPNLKVTY